MRLTYELDGTKVTFFVKRVRRDKSIQKVENKIPGVIFIDIKYSLGIFRAKICGLSIKTVTTRIITLRVALKRSLVVTMTH